MLEISRVSGTGYMSAKAANHIIKFSTKMFNKLTDSVMFIKLEHGNINIIDTNMRKVL